MNPILPGVGAGMNHAQQRDHRQKSATGQLE
jgi:hypothetical protein